MEWLTGIFDATVTGGVAGLLGTLFTGFMTYKEKQASREHELKMRSVDMDERRLESELSIKTLNAENEGKLTLAEMSAFSNSYNQDRASYSSGTTSTILIVVDAVRGLMRPVLTMALVGITGYMTLEAIDALGGWGSVQQQYAKEILESMVQNLLFCTTTAVTWWFGTRALQAHQKTKT